MLIKGVLPTTLVGLEECEPLPCSMYVNAEQPEDRVQVEQHSHEVSVLKVREQCTEEGECRKISTKKVKGILSAVANTQV